ncbi:MAG TPA: DUF6596 domain-containing protein, partial [candidate division Zixibacteria bacterium]|nr:DUF6596 domain-containing protein [candidate division Zixibacteria bacterium]
SPEAIAQRLSRARQTLRDTYDEFALADNDVAVRLPSALEALYLLFSEGYNAHSGDRLIREELCAEALRLTGSLLTHKRAATPEVEALLALMLFQAARLSTRVGAEGVPVLLDQQDRSRWDRALINEGFDHLQRSITDSAPTRYHLQAGIAAAHAAAQRYEDTDWDLILRYYDDLLALDQSPVIAVNRAVALARAQGAAAGVRALRELLEQPFVERFHLYWVALGDLQRELGDAESARECYEKALTLVSVEPERRLLEWKLAGLNI